MRDQGRRQPRRCSWRQAYPRYLGKIRSSYEEVLEVDDVPHWWMTSPVELLEEVEKRKDASLEDMRIFGIATHDPRIRVGCDHRGAGGALTQPRLTAVRDVHRLAGSLPL